MKYSDLLEIIKQEAQNALQGLSGGTASQMSDEIDKITRKQGNYLRTASSSISKATKDFSMSTKNEDESDGQDEQ